MSFSEVATEHHLWLKKLTGQWTSEFKYVMGTNTCSYVGTESSRMIGDLWYQGDGTSKPKEGEQGMTMVSQFTVGYDAKANGGKGAFVATFISDNVSRMWHYEGQREGNVLSLSKEVDMPCGENGATQKKTILEELTLVDDNHKRLVAKMSNEDGSFNEFMWMDCHRVLSQ